MRDNCLFYSFVYFRIYFFMNSICSAIRWRVIFCFLASPSLFLLLYRFNEGEKITTTMTASFHGVVFFFFSFRFAMYTGTHHRLLLFFFEFLLRNAHSSIFEQYTYESFFSSSFVCLFQYLILSMGREKI